MPSVNIQNVSHDSNKNVIQKVYSMTHGEALRMAQEAKKMAFNAQATASTAKESAVAHETWIKEHEKTCGERWKEVQANSKDIKDFMKFVAVLLISIIVKLTLFT